MIYSFFERSSVMEIGPGNVIAFLLKSINEIKFFLDPQSLLTSYSLGRNSEFETYKVVQIIGPWQSLLSFRSVGINWTRVIVFIQSLTFLFFGLAHEFNHDVFVTSGHPSEFIVLVSSVHFGHISEFSCLAVPWTMVGVAFIDLVSFTEIGHRTVVLRLTVKINSLSGIENWRFRLHDQVDIPL
ncbi:hypothetical protein BD770DRAFT_416800 [Pilaira anomala]|nr:hypothetical protein BD770DRAFT_416800 [Pilaira anomala]